jgi:hypothetical protein
MDRRIQRRVQSKFGHADLLCGDSWRESRNPPSLSIQAFHSLSLLYPMPGTIYACGFTEHSTSVESSSPTVGMTDGQPANGKVAVHCSHSTMCTQRGAQLVSVAKLYRDCLRCALITAYQQDRPAAQYIQMVRFCRSSS